MWWHDACRMGRGAVAVQIRIDGVDKVKVIFDGSKNPIKMRGVRRQ